MSQRNDYLKAAARLSEFLGLLSRGCHVRIGGAVYALFGSNGIQVAYITGYTRAMRDGSTPPWRDSGGGESTSLVAWLMFFIGTDFGPFEVMYDPNRQPVVETRNVRRVEL